MNEESRISCPWKCDDRWIIYFDPEDRSVGIMSIQVHTVVGCCEHSQEINSMLMEDRILNENETAKLNERLDCITDAIYDAKQPLEYGREYDDTNADEKFVEKLTDHN